MPDDHVPPAPRMHPAEPPPRPELVEIARRVLSIPTLETRYSDSLDFHDVAVWCVREALERAYDLGRAATPREPDAITCPDCGESDHDHLLWHEDDTLTCQTCGTRFNPAN